MYTNSTIHTKLENGFLSMWKMEMTFLNFDILSQANSSKNLEYEDIMANFEA